MPAVSVILSSYNQSEYLACAVDSVIQQTFDDWELIIVDNGSTDDSRKVLGQYANHPKIRTIFYETNEAVTKRLNRAISQARGEFISILYSDDYYLQNKLALELDIFSRQPTDCGVVYTPGYRLNTSSGEKWTDPTLSASGWIASELVESLCQAQINPISPLIRKECFLRYPFYEDVFIEGEGIFFRFAMTYRFQFDATPTVVMRDHPQNIGRNLKRNIPVTLTCLDRLEAHPDLPASVKPVLQNVKTRFLRNCGWMIIRSTHDKSWSREMFLQSFSRDWFQLLHPKTLFGLGLTTLPTPILATVNALGFRIKRAHGHTNNVN